MKGQVLHRLRAHLKVPASSSDLSTLLTRKFLMFLSHLNEIIPSRPRWKIKCHPSSSRGRRLDLERTNTFERASELLSVSWVNKNLNLNLNFFFWPRAIVFDPEPHAVTQACKGLARRLPLVTKFSELFAKKSEQS